ncbi:hypothetical protein OG21DRAFT_219753 [Imleria badia]|nr:hypothetical protein OG21DRAFT_219753 [Imleria badia]
MGWRRFKGAIKVRCSCLYIVNVAHACNDRNPILATRETRSTSQQCLCPIMAPFTIHRYMRTKNSSWKPTKLSNGNKKRLIVFWKLKIKSGSSRVCCRRRCGGCPCWDGR